MTAPNGPTMYDTETAFEGIRLQVDPITRDRTDDSDNVMAMFEEEQPFTWRFVKPFINNALTTAKGLIGFLDVGTGSGVFSILVAKHFPGTKIRALDKSMRAVQFAFANAVHNGVKFDVFHASYSLQMAPELACRMIGLYPPYHLYPEAVSNNVPQHARGGSNGQQEFVNQLLMAQKHVAKNGIVFFNQMCWGDESGPEFLTYIPQYFRGASLMWCNVFPRMSTREFLEGVYAGRTEDVYRQYIEESSTAHPWLYYTVGIITNDDLGEVQEVPHRIDLKGRSWADRIALHREIASHAWR